MKKSNNTTVAFLESFARPILSEKRGHQDNQNRITDVPKPVRILQSIIGSLLTEVKEKSGVLYWTAMAILGIGVICIGGILVDDRTLLGVSVWLKPLKFSLSIALYLLTVGYLITKYPYSSLKKNIIIHLSAWSMFLEFAIIAFQGARGVPSHYNVNTSFDGILFLLMGVFVGMNIIVMVLFIFDTIRLKLKTTRAMQWSILFGWTIVLFGSWVGGQMIRQAGHSVGIADGGEGLPLVNWSTVAGDLRIAHFLGLHAIQILPCFAFWLAKKGKLETKIQIVAVILFAILYASWIGFVFYQAKQGIPMISL